ncbi:MAG TPA: histidinol dehydrogenase [Pyrinomonadaceae bacterium]|nr:histidinol dehydrogenase [Pyrinomonadaceae bacterium]
MIETISTSEKHQLAAKLKRIRERNILLDADLMTRVAEILAEVRQRGDLALIEYAEQFDSVVMTAADLRVREEVLCETALKVDLPVLEALREAIRRITRFHEHQSQESWEVNNGDGVVLGQRVIPIESAGLYVPGGTAAYPSSVLMNVIPAQIAGVDRIIVATPPNTIKQNPAVAAALVELKVTEVYAVGGAQAIAALAYGTETIPRVDKIAGPGNRYVAAAKKQVFGVVGIDSIAGPSEVVIIADDSADPSFVASDMLAQAEHSEDAAAIFLTDSRALVVEVIRELGLQLTQLPRSRTIEKSLEHYGAIIIVEDLQEACAIVNEIAPEHVEILVQNEDEISSRIRNAGAVFLGQHSPAVIGDYLAGPSHVLPTGGAARFSSALSVYDFVKRTSVVRYSQSELQNTAQLIAVLASSERLDAHAKSVLRRLEGNECLDR